MDYWADHPPVHVILRAVHFKPSANRRTKKQEDSPDMFAELGKFGLGAVAGKLPKIYQDN